MANIGVRSPFFYSLANLSGEYFKITLTINGTLRYTIAKSSPDEAHFDISELIRDYIDFVYDGTMPSPTNFESLGYSAEVAVGYEIYSTSDGSGSPIDTGGITFDAYDAYSLFEDQDDDYNLPANGVLLTNKTIWLPENTTGSFYYVTSNVISKQDVSTSATSITVAGDTVTIRRFPCSKYDAKKVVFINRYGMPQQLWFFGKTIGSSSFTSEQYKSSNITGGGIYNKYEHQYKKFDVNSRTKYVLNTGFVSEDYNDSITELMLSEQVWIHTDSTVRPINVTSSDVTYRTSLNDKMVEYSIEVEQANDLISTMR